MKALGCEAIARTTSGEPPIHLRVPKVQRSANKVDDLPDELPEASVGWTENPEHAQ